MMLTMTALFVPFYLILLLKCISRGQLLQSPHGWATIWGGFCGCAGQTEARVVLGGQPAYVAEVGSCGGELGVDGLKSREGSTWFVLRRGMVARIMCLQ